MIEHQLVRRQQYHGGRWFPIGIQSTPPFHKWFQNTLFRRKEMVSKHRNDDDRARQLTGDCLQLRQIASLYQRPFSDRLSFADDQLRRWRKIAPFITS